MTYGTVDGKTYGFYTPDTPLKSSVSIPNDEHMALIEKVNGGKQHIEPDANGYPVLVDNPAPTAEETKAASIASLKAQISAIEQKELRSACSVANGTATEEDKTALTNYETQKADLRTQLQELEA